MTCILNKSVGLQQNTAASPSSVACTVFDIKFTEVKCLQPWKVIARYGEYTKWLRTAGLFDNLPSLCTLYIILQLCSEPIYSSVVTHRRDTNPGVWTWVGLSSVSCHHNMMLQCFLTHPIIPVIRTSIAYGTHMDTKDEIQLYMLRLAYHDSQYDVQVAGLLLTQLHNHFVDLAQLRQYPRLQFINRKSQLQHIKSNKFGCSAHYHNKACSSCVPNLGALTD